MNFIEGYISIADITEHIKLSHYSQDTWDFGIYVSIKMLLLLIIYKMLPELV